MRTRVVFFSSDTTESLESMVSSFVNANNVQVVNVSLSSCYDEAHNGMVFSVGVVYSFEE
jgi:hypothetical protein